MQIIITAFIRRTHMFERNKWVLKKIKKKKKKKNISDA